jgi:hypothetical protein
MLLHGANSLVGRPVSTVQVPARHEATLADAHVSRTILIQDASYLQRSTDPRLQACQVWNKTLGIPKLPI